MDVERITDTIALIKSQVVAGDNEAAYGTEVRLYKDVLRAIAARRWDGSSPEELAKEALKASCIEYNR